MPQHYQQLDSHTMDANTQADMLLFKGLEYMHMICILKLIAETWQKLGAW